MMEDSLSSISDSSGLEELERLNKHCCAMHDRLLKKVH